MSSSLWSPCISAAQIPEVPVVETTPSSAATLPAVANTPQSFEPTKSECASFATTGDVMRWSGFPSGPSNAALCKRQSFLLVLGTKETDHVRVLANLAAVQFDELLQDWKVDDASPPAARLSKGGLVGRPCRVAVGTEDRMSVKRRREDQLFELQLCRERNMARASTPPPAAAAAAPAADPGDKRVQITTVLERVDIEYQAFRAEERKEPAVPVLARANRMSVRLDGHAEVHGGSGVAGAASGTSAAAARHATWRQSPRQHHVGADGMLTTNRRGRKLCPKVGKRVSACHLFRVVSVCPRDRGVVHQCARCLWTQHGAKFHQLCTTPVAQQPKGKGKCKHDCKKGRHARVTPSCRRRRCYD